MSINPKISVLCPVYNHEKYVGLMIESILNQTFDNFELIIVDDCSTDATVEEIKKYDDKRIKLYTKEFNQGINHSINLALSNAQGDICVLMGSDDLLENDYLEDIYNKFENNIDIGVIYSSQKIIDENGNFIKENGKYKVDILKKKDKYQILNHSFLLGNYLLSPGMAIKTELLKTFYPFDTSILHMQDYQMNVILLLNSEILVLDTTKVLYRHSTSHDSVSRSCQATLSREDAEIPKLLDTYLKISDLETLKNIFPNNKNDFKYKELIPYYLGKLALSSTDKNRQIWGYRTIMNFISLEENKINLWKYEKIDFSKYISMITDFHEENPLLKKYLKYKKLYKILLIFSLISLLSLLILIIF